MNAQIQSNVKELVQRLNQYRDAYYNHNRSLISDEEYDRLFDRLEKLEKETGIVYSNSPTQSVGYEVVSKLEKVKHNHELLSLGKTTEIEDIEKYFESKQTVIMAKMDGLTASLLYQNGKLVRAESRGNGEIGEDITHNARVFANCPQQIPYNGTLIVDGECIIDYETFEEINKNEQTEYKNPRNLVSGSVRQLNSEIAAKRNIRFIAWKLYLMLDENGNKETPSEMSDAFSILNSLGFEVVPFCVHPGNSIFKSYEIAIETIKCQCEKERLPIDGCVVAFNDIEYGNSLGSTGHHPKHSLAYKFYQERNETTLLDIEWTTSRTGLINPVAVVEPVEIDGTTVSRATLNNVSIIKELKLGIGDSVTIIKANQIIPMIVENLTQSDTYEIPNECPDCHSPAIIKNDTGRETLYCTNPQCPSRLHDKMANFCNREGMNIVGLSDERLKMLMRLGYISDFSSIYHLYEHEEEIIKLDGYGKSSVEKLLQSIEESKNNRLSNIITAIGIPGIGKSAAKSIAKHISYLYHSIPGSEFINSFDMFLHYCLTDYDWTCLSDFGKKTSCNINTYIKSSIKELCKLVEIVGIIDDKEENAHNNKLGGKTFCITGKLIHFVNRDALVEEIEKYGGKIVSGVTAKTNYLITNNKESGSSKNQKAIKYGTQIISEEEFIELCSKK